jgi:mannose-6-phosphate isomerase-like protein (cupin superfamily)
MNVKEYIASGIIESFCLGFTTPEEAESLKQMAALHPEVQEEMDKVRTSMNNIIKETAIKPRPFVKTAVMNKIYSQQSLVHPQYIPLLHEPVDFERIYESAKVNYLEMPSESFENIYMQDLPSTNEIINFAVWVKNGHEEELHTDRMEYIAILDGSCDMIMNGVKKAYTKGQVITIPINVPHHAVITSEQPMFALVQRQLIPNECMG